MKSTTGRLVCFLSLIIQPSFLFAQTAQLEWSAAEAMHSARTVYIQDDEQTTSKKGKTPSAAFLSFYNGVQALGRYQLVPNTAGADVVLHFGAIPDEPVFQVAALDGKNLGLLGSQIGKQYHGLLDVSKKI